LLRSKAFVEGVLVRVNIRPTTSGDRYTIDRITTHGRFRAETIAWDKVDLPDPELPAIPIILTSAHGGE
jgi:hypothetical protein